MFDNLGGINGFSIAVAAVASFALGGVWFAAFFSRQYALALGRENATPLQPAGIFLAGPFVCGLISAATSAVLVQALNVDSIGGAAALGALVGFGYLASTTVNTAINPNIPRPLLYGLISGAYFLVSSMLVCVILVAMR